MATTRDTIVLVPGAASRPGAFLATVGESLLRWLEESGADDLIIEPAGLGGSGPATVRLAGRLPGAGASGTGDDFDWRMVEASWWGACAPSPDREATAWALRALLRALADRSAYAHPLTLVWRMPYDLTAPFWRSRVPRAVLTGLLVPLAFLLLTWPVLLPATLLWFVSGALDRWVRAYWATGHRLLLVLASLPAIAAAGVVLIAIWFLALLPLDLPWLGAARRATLSLLRLRFVDSYAIEAERLNGAAIDDAVAMVIAAELDDARSLTVIGFEEGGVVAYQALSGLARSPRQPALQAPYVTVAQALAAISRPLPRPGLAVALVTVGSFLNQALGCATRPLFDSGLPAGARWHDLFAADDPVALGPVDRRLVEASGAAFEDTEVSLPGGLADHSRRYWRDTAEVVATVAGHLLSAANAPSSRLEHGLPDAGCLAERSRRIARTTAAARTAACLAAVAMLALRPLPSGSQGRLTALGDLLVAVVLAVIACAFIDTVGVAATRVWARRPCRHSHARRVAVRV